MNPDLEAAYYIFMGMIGAVLWAIVLADTKVGKWITDNPISRRYIQPVWEQIKRPVQWAFDKASRR